MRLSPYQYMSIHPIQLETRLVRPGNLFPVINSLMAELAGCIKTNPTIDAYGECFRWRYLAIFRFFGEKCFDVEYKITAIEKIEHPESIIKNSFSGATLAGTALGLFVVGLIIGVMGYYVFLRKRNPPADYTVHLTTMKG
ncbi:hypothetical protein AVEN_127198-1 [Araneus ventricosus]|uniref:Uncharacterized protein n=1 Tax=Araneus ventricosus TaxID=182803 RepID=A0A4Y2V2T1_ARAVE|nr:hypothetical protein AVEN_127198-1 [Araneus ventricosus]